MIYGPTKSTEGCRLNFEYVSMQSKLITDYKRLDMETSTQPSSIYEIYLHIGTLTLMHCGGNVYDHEG